MATHSKVQSNCIITMAYKTLCCPFISAKTLCSTGLRHVNSSLNWSIVYSAQELDLLGLPRISGPASVHMFPAEIRILRITKHVQISSGDFSSVHIWL